MKMRLGPPKMKCVGWDHVVQTWRVSGVHVLLLLKGTRRGRSRFVALCSSSCRGELWLETADQAGERHLLLETARTAQLAKQNSWQNAPLLLHELNSQAFFETISWERGKGDVCQPGPSLICKAAGETLADVPAS